MEKRIAVLRRVWNSNKSKAWLDIPWSTLLQRLILPEVKGHKTTCTLANREEWEYQSKELWESLLSWSLFWLVTLLWAKRMIYTGLIPENCRKSILDNYPGSEASLEDLAKLMNWASENHFVLQVNLLIKFLLHTNCILSGSASRGFCTSSKSSRQERGVDCLLASSLADMAHVKLIAILKGELRCPKLQGCFLC